MMVLVSAAVLLPPIYFVILQTPIELVPHSQKVINYFYDGRIFIGISKVVPNDGKAFEGVHDENWRAIRRLRERDVWHEGTDDPEINIDDSELPSEIDQSVEEALHSPSALSLPPDLVEPVTQSAADQNRQGPKRRLHDGNHLSRARSPKRRYEYLPERQRGLQGCVSLHIWSR